MLLAVQLTYMAAWKMGQMGGAGQEQTEPNMQDPPKASSLAVLIARSPFQQSFNGREPAGDSPLFPGPPLALQGPSPRTTLQGRNVPWIHLHWGQTDDSRELRVSGSQIPLPLSQPPTVLEVQRNLKCDRQNNTLPLKKDVHALIPGMHYLTWQRGLCRWIS